MSEQEWTCWCDHEIAGESRLTRCSMGQRRTTWAAYHLTTKPKHSWCNTTSMNLSFFQDDLKDFDSTYATWSLVSERGLEPAV